MTLPRPIIGPEASEELMRAARWYESQSKGLGVEFLDTAELVFGRVSESPDQYPVVFRDLQRALMPRFPFGVFYRQRGERVKVLAVIHLASDPMRWQSTVLDRS